MFVNIYVKMDSERWQLYLRLLKVKLSVYVYLRNNLGSSEDEYCTKVTEHL
jgi:hypothetical protein